jgi:hypothetical protein
MAVPEDFCADEDGSIGLLEQKAVIPDSFADIARGPFL